MLVVRKTGPAGYATTRLAIHHVLTRMKRRPVITIIIPTYNRAHELERCMASVVTQRFAGLEVIIVDDGSTDATRSLLEKWRQLYSFVRVIYNRSNAGVNYSRNRGVEQARGYYILFLDSDDHLVKEGLASVVSAIRTNPLCPYFLFLLADRGAEFKSRPAARQIAYQDWLKGTIGGDFIQVIATGLMKKYPFFEQFRMFEYLNWLRVKREAGTQLLVPRVVAEREAGRADSLTTRARLNSQANMLAKFESKKMFYTLYREDLQRYNGKSLRFQLLEAVMLGTACNKQADCRALIRYADRHYIRWAGHLILLIPAVLIRHSILTYTGIKMRSLL